MRRHGKAVLQKSKVIDRNTALRKVVRIYFEQFFFPSNSKDVNPKNKYSH